MNEYVKQSIDGRRLAFSSAYELTDVYKKKVENLFKKIEEFGKNCTDAMDFETKFMASPLNKEYTDLFTEVATNCKYILPPPVEGDTAGHSNKEAIMDEVMSDVKYAVDDITMPARRAAREEFDSKMRDTPLGQIEQARNTAFVFKRLFGKKNKNEP